MFKWSCLGLAVVSLLVLGWAINDLRMEIKQASQNINEKLPLILENTKKTSNVLATVAEDIKQLRDLAGVANGPRDSSLVLYADSVLDLVQDSDGEIGLTKKVFGSGLKELSPTKEWVVGERKEALWLSFRAKSKKELLEGICTNAFGSDWYLLQAEKEPIKLQDWLALHHPETKNILSEENAEKE